MQDSTPQIRREVGQYIIRNIFASSGLSLYVLVDTVFIAAAGGTLGLAALNISLPMFNFFNALGLLFGIGGSTIYSIHKLKQPEKVATFFWAVTHLLFWAREFIGAFAKSLPTADFDAVRGRFADHGDRTGLF